MGQLNTPPHVYITIWGEFHNAGQTYSNERGRGFYSRCSIVAAACAI